ncbi:MAG TPA: hypothetical protein HA364_03770 [Thermoplasmata archaeon]|nr:hypothetical protein [Thermoplasmata archaeon]
MRISESAWLKIGSSRREALKPSNTVSTQGALMNHGGSTRTGRKIRSKTEKDATRYTHKSEPDGVETPRCPNCGAEKTREGLMCPVCYYWDSENTPRASTNDVEGEDTGPTANQHSYDYIGILILFAVCLMIIGWAWIWHLEDELLYVQNPDEIEDIESQLDTAGGMWKSGVVIASLGAAALAFTTKGIFTTDRRT